MKRSERPRKVSLMIRAKVDAKWIRTRVVYGKSGRVVPGLVLYKGEEIRVADASYDLRFYEHGKPVYRPVGDNASNAEMQRRIFASQRTAAVIAESAGLTVTSISQRMTLRQAASDYIAKRSVDLGPDQIARIRYVIALLSECCKKTYIEDLVERDILAFVQYVSCLPVWRRLRSNPSKRRNAVQRRLRYPVEPKLVSKRTVFNYFVVLYKWLVTMGVDKSIFPTAPKFEEREVTIYSPEELKPLFEVLQGPLRIALSLMLMCGLRRREVSYAYFSDIDWANKVLLVRGKSEWNFVVKNRLQRYVPIPDALLHELQEWADSHRGQCLIVTNSAGKPELRLIRTLKRFVYLHGLRCGLCKHCKSGNPDCQNWELHKFRRTYATTLVRNIDLRTAQQYLGHKRITSTERYLKAASAADGQKRVSGIDWMKPCYE